MLSSTQLFFTKAFILRRDIYQSHTTYLLVLSLRTLDTESHVYSFRDSNQKTLLRTAMPKPSDTPVSTDNHEENRPRGCVLVDCPAFPKTAVPEQLSEQVGFQEALLAPHDTFHDIIVSVVVDSATIKAWFALILPHKTRRGASAKRTITPRWGQTWELIRNGKAKWNEQYATNGQPATQWELHEPSSVGELYALAMFVLYRKVHDNPEKDEKRVAGLKWCRNYDEDEGKFFLLYNFLIFLGNYCIGSGEIQFRRPTDKSNIRAWIVSRGGKMHAAVQEFLAGEWTGLQTTAAPNALY